MAIKILKSRYFIWPAIFISIIIVCILFYLANIEDKVIFPNSESYIYDFYTDEPNGGNSQILEHVVSDSVIKLDFVLRDGFQSPYVGLSITPLVSEYINAGKYRSGIYFYTCEMEGFADRKKLMILK